VSVETLSVLDKKILLDDLAKRLHEIYPAPDVDKIIGTVGSELEHYDVDALPDYRIADESEGLLKLFLDTRRSEGLSEKTLYQYKSILTRFHNGVGVSFSKVNAFHIRNYLSSELDRGISPATVERIRSSICTFFGWLHREELIEKNPCNNISPIKQKKVIRKPFTETELYKLTDNAGNKRNLAIIEFLTATGCRVSEMCNVDRADVDFTNLQLRVLGKGNKERAVLINEKCALRLQEYLAERTDDAAPLFITQMGNRFDPGGVRLMLRKIGKRANVTNVHPHRFRRTLATHLMDKGMAVQEVSVVLGHEKIDTTMTYLYINQKNVEHSYRKYI